MQLSWYNTKNRIAKFLPQIPLFFYSVLALFPIILIVMNSFKERKAIFRAPYLPPTAETFSFKGYITLFDRANFELYFLNSFIVVGVSMFFILLLGAMAAFALAEYDFPGNPILGIYLAIGIMIPIRLGTVSILRLVVSLGLINTLTALILVYIAQGLPMAIFILTQFMKTAPKELKDAARVDGASEYRIFWLVLPLVRPAIATVAIFTMVPIWNDLWFPLILANGEKTKTVTLGSQVFLGQFVIDWNAVLSSLSLAMVPVLILYLIFSKNLIRNITAGSVK
ncbi:MAG: carbohydrate ABC transporter permease [Anaerolineaceae bacterium]|nr:carbohydrate ABC transporter permease [Anaerolineaceae bacterium]